MECFAFVYAAEFHDGRIKVGATRNAKARLGTLSVMHKTELRNFKAFPCLKSESPFRVERTLIGRMARLSPFRIGRETFMGIPFGAAANLARQLAKRDPSEEGREWERLAYFPMPRLSKPSKRTAKA